MARIITLGIFAFALSFFVMLTSIHAQTTSPTPISSVSVTTSPTVTPGAPNTGFGY